MSHSFGTLVLSCFQADDSAVQRANTGQYLPDVLRHLHKHGGGWTGYTVGTKDQPRLCCHPEAAGSAQLPLSDVLRALAIPQRGLHLLGSLGRQVYRRLQQAVWEMSNTPATTGRSQERTASQGGVEVPWAESRRWRFWVEELFCSEAGHIWASEYMGAREQDGLGKSKGQVKLQKV